MKIRKKDWLFDGNRENYCNKVMHFLITNGATLSKFLVETKVLGIDLPPEVIKELKARLSANPL